MTHSSRRDLLGLQIIRMKKEGIVARRVFIHPELGINGVKFV